MENVPEQKRQARLGLAITAFHKVPGLIDIDKIGRDVRKYVARKNPELQGLGLSVSERRRRHPALCILK
ncbi:MAG: hypothetical protein AAB573_00310 [Patescibacteria group bacterium]